MALTISYFQPEDCNEWDNFVLKKSMNGILLQTRKFINYHAKDKFNDASLCIRKGNQLVATILANYYFDDNKKIFFAHQGSTFGGICISKQIYKTAVIDELISELLIFLKNEKFNKIILKMGSPIYQNEDTSLLNYFLYKYGFMCYNELNFYMKMDRYQNDILSQFSKSKRRDYKYSLKSNLEFKSLSDKDEIALFYNVLLLNLKKLNLKPVHSLDDLYDLKYNRFNDEIKFYGVFLNDDLIAGSMVFIFNDNIFHTQYLSSDEQYLKLYPMDFLIYNLINEAIKLSTELFSFGICTENRGKYINLGLSKFKEGFGSEFSINRTYEICYDK